MQEMEKKNWRKNSLIPRNRYIVVRYDDFTISETIDNSKSLVQNWKEKEAPDTVNSTERQVVTDFLQMSDFHNLCDAFHLQAAKIFCSESLRMAFICVKHDCGWHGG